MSVFYGVRIPDELSARIETSGKGKTDVIVDALRLYFGEPVEAPKEIIIEKPKERPRPKIEKPTKVEEPKTEEKKPCPRCEGPTVKWGTMRRCQKCGVNF